MSHNFHLKRNTICAIIFLSFVLCGYSGYGKASSSEVSIIEVFIILITIAILTGFALYPLRSKKPLAKTPVGMFFQLVISSMCTWIVICIFWIDTQGRSLKAGEKGIGMLFIAAALAFIMNFIHSVKYRVEFLKKINSDNELRIKYNEERRAGWIIFGIISALLGITSCTQLLVCK